MAKNEPALAEAAPTQTITLDEFCSRLSETVKRPELLGAFHHVELAEGHSRDTAEAFRARFDEFLNTPV